MSFNYAHNLFLTNRVVVLRREGLGEGFGSGGSGRQRGQGSLGGEWWVRFWIGFQCSSLTSARLGSFSICLANSCNFTINSRYAYSWIVLLTPEQCLGWPEGPQPPLWGQSLWRTVVEIVPLLAPSSSAERAGVDLAPGLAGSPPVIEPRLFFFQSLTGMRWKTIRKHTVVDWVLVNGAAVGAWDYRNKEMSLKCEASATWGILVSWATSLGPNLWIAGASDCSRVLGPRVFSFCEDNGACVNGYKRLLSKKALTLPGLKVSTSKLGFPWGCNWPPTSDPKPPLAWGFCLPNNWEVPKDRPKPLLPKLLWVGFNEPWKPGWEKGLKPPLFCGLLKDCWFLGNPWKPWPWLESPVKPLPKLGLPGSWLKGLEFLPLWGRLNPPLPAPRLNKKLFALAPSPPNCVGFSALGLWGKLKFGRWSWKVNEFWFKLPPFSSLLISSGSCGFSMTSSGTSSASSSLCSGTEGNRSSGTAGTGGGSVETTLVAWAALT